MTSPTGSGGPAWPTQDPDAPPPDIAQNVEMRATVNRVDHIVSSAFGIPTPDGPAISVGDSGGGAGNYFKLDPDQVRNYYGQFQDIVDEAKQLWTLLGNLRNQAYPPADNGPSHAQMNASKESLDKAIKHLQGIIAYGTAYHNKLARSVHDYENVEDANTHKVSKASGDAGSEGLV